MSKKKTLLLLQKNNLTIEKLLTDMGYVCTTDRLSRHDAVVVSGHSFVNPLLYGDLPMRTGRIETDDVRDADEWGFLRRSAFKKPKIGLVRGAHLLNVLSGGGLWQRVDGHMLHTEGHYIQRPDDDKHIIKVSSHHTQMMRPTKLGQVLLECYESRKRERSGVTEEWKGKGFPPWSDPEIVYYAHTNSLCFQPTPGMPNFPETDELLKWAIDSQLFPR